ncbi:MAG: hypothetical protein P8010_21585 [Desulfosarcinaceae bacterium]
MADPFYKFWSEFFRQVAAGQQQLTAMGSWIQSGCSPKDALADLFRRCYGLPPAKTMGEELWQKVTAEFVSAANAYAPLWGWVPLARYDRLKRKNEELERRISALERTIKQLDALLAEKGMGHAALMTRFQELINDQTVAFDQLIQTFTEADSHEH